MKYWSILPRCVLLVVMADPALAAPDTDCFRRADNQHLSYDVFQISPAPAYVKASGDYRETSASYPVSDYTTNNIGSIKDISAKSASNFKFKKSYLLWVNRCTNIPGVTPSLEACRNTRPSKGNGYSDVLKTTNGEQIRSLFSTYAKANTCTLIQARRALADGGLDELAKQAQAAGLAALVSNLDRSELERRAQQVTVSGGERRMALLDVCVTESVAQASDAEGLMLDYEVWDYRTPAEVGNFLQELRKLTRQHNEKLMLATNQLPRTPNGIDASNVREIIGIVDVFAVTIATGASPGNEEAHVLARSRKLNPLESYREQLAVITKNNTVPLDANTKAKLIWTVALNDLNISEARQLHDEFKREGYRGVMIFRNFARQGGSCSQPVNQVIACLTLGDCSGSFGRDRWF